MYQFWKNFGNSYNNMNWCTLHFSSPSEESEYQEYMGKSKNIIVLLFFFSCLVFLLAKMFLLGAGDLNFVDEWDYFTPGILTFFFIISIFFFKYKKDTWAKMCALGWNILISWYSLHWGLCFVQINSQTIQKDESWAFFSFGWGIVFIYFITFNFFFINNWYFLFLAELTPLVYLMIQFGLSSLLISIYLPL